jgi:hypothetical protein
MESTKSILLAALVVASFGLAAADCGQEAAREPGVREADAGVRVAEEFDRAVVDSLPGAPGLFDSESGTYRLSVPRNDLVVTVDGAILAPRISTEGWVVFQPVPGGAVLTAELPMLGDEVNPVISAALLHDLRVTGLHPHFSREEPRLWYLHLAGIGETDSLAVGVGAVLQTLEDVKGQPRDPAPPLDATTTLDTAAVDSVLGLRGQRRQGDYEVTLPRSTRLEGYELGGPSGIATRVAFAGSDTRAVASGSFALSEGELQEVLKALRAGRIDITSIDDPLVGEEPRLVFVRFWGRGRATDLARAIRDALDAMTPSGR